MSPEMLSSLATLSTENTIAENLDFSVFVKTFAVVEVRQINSH
jgi:hypothetical protein